MADCVAVIGEGSWGTTLATLIARGGNTARLFCHFRENAEAIKNSGSNPQVFQNVKLDPGVSASADLEYVLDGVDVALLVIPTRFLREFFSNNLQTWSSWAAGNPILCNCTKGLLLDPTQRTDEWLNQLLPEATLVHLAGPNLAGELMDGKPAAAVAAGPEAAAGRVQKLLMSDIYRIYTGRDTTGVEVAGFYKNIIAIAAGCISELGLGVNTRSVLITRGLAEMGRLVHYFGGDSATLGGLAGLGDLITTCSSEKSRNFQVGMRRARGQTLEQINEEMTQIAEGIQACQAVHKWPEEHGLQGWPDLPIADEVYRFVHEGVEPGEAIDRLMRRPARAE